MKNLYHLLSGIALSFGIVSYASAELVTIESTVDLSSAYFYCNATYPCGLDSSFPLPQSVMISAGDSVDMTVRFAKGQALQMTNTGGTDYFPAFLFLDYTKSGMNSSSGYMSNLALTLFDNTGQNVLNLYDPLQYFGSAGIGGQFVGSILQPNKSITFSSYRTTFNVDSLTGGSQYYSGPNVGFFEINQGTVRLVSENEVPEPSTMWLSLLGLMVLGGAAQRRKARLRAELTYCVRMR